ncbi:MAG: DegT/DnrJ/EryC1/StrS family aminotransferase [Gammaproteobacteria bacterium]
MVDFLPPLADAADYPPPCVPPLPYLGYRDLWFRGRGGRAHAAGRHQEVTISGRAAIGRIAEVLALGRHSRVLVPAYHCPSVVEPLLACGANVEFYPLEKDLRPSLREFEELLGPPTDLVVFIRYFGFAPDTTAALTSARRAGASVLHDCAHAYYALTSIPSNDFAIASLVKFFPFEEGGLACYPESVVLRRRPLEACPSGRDVRLLWHALERTHRSQRGRLFPLSTLVALLNAVRDAYRPSSRMVTGEGNVTRDAAFRYYDVGCVDEQPALLTRILLMNLDRARVAARRRENYRRIADWFSNRRDVRALFPELPDGVVPYVFPLVLGSPGWQFDALRRRGVPLYRWEELAPSSCTVSAEYRASLVQLPCHQDLTERDLQRLSEAVSVALGMY